MLLDGFFPVVSSTDMPQARRRVGLQEIGLPYAADAAITRHLAKFLRQQARAGFGASACTHVLFNGGVLRAGLVRDRLLEVLNRWLAAEGKPAVKVLAGEDLMHAVSRGAAYYGLRGRDAACASAAACRAHTMSASRRPCPRCPVCPRR